MYDLSAAAVSVPEDMAPLPAASTSASFTEIFPAGCQLPSSTWPLTAKFVGGCDKTLQISLCVLQEPKACSCT